MQNYGLQDRAVATETRPLLAEVNGKFDTANNRLKMNLDQLEDKLHSILNKRTPDKTSVENKVAEMNSAIQSLNYQAEIFFSQNERFERLLSHLSEII